MDLADVLKVVGGLAGGSAGVTLLNYLTASRAAGRDDFTALLDARRKEADEQAATIADLRTRFETAMTSISLLQKRVAAIEVDRDNMPVPMWIVDTTGHYLSVNVRFVNDFLLPRGMSEVDVIGKTHTDIWSAATAKTLHDLDMAAMKSPERRARVDSIRMNGLDEVVTIFKAPILNGRTLVGFTGIAIPHLDSVPAKA